MQKYSYSITICSPTNTFFLNQLCQQVSKQPLFIALAHSSYIPHHHIWHYQSFVAIQTCPRHGEY